MLFAIQESIGPNVDDKLQLSSTNVLCSVVIISLIRTLFWSVIIRNYFVPIICNSVFIFQLLINYILEAIICCYCFSSVNGFERRIQLLPYCIFPLVSR